MTVIPLSPFGKYASFAAIVGAFVIVAVWGIQHILGVVDKEVDQAFLLAIGVILGTASLQQQATIDAARHLNGTKATIEALHRRLDKAGIPQSNVDTEDAP